MEENFNIHFGKKLGLRKILLVFIKLKRLLIIFEQPEIPTTSPKNNILIYFFLFVIIKSNLISYFLIGIFFTS